jgi:membrane-bound lytic murein transglycosylase B
MPEERTDDGIGLQVTEVRVLPAEEGFDEPVAADGAAEEAGASTASDWLPGIKDEHEDDGWSVKWLDRPTWDHTVTPNVIKRTGTRPPRGRRGR